MDDIQRAKLIESHIEECKHRISVINSFMETNSDADEDNCCENILRLKTAITALRELQQYRQIGLTPKQISEVDALYLEKCQEINALKEKLNHYEELRQQGRLLELPCAVGDTVYEIIHDDIPVHVDYIAKYPVEDISTKAIKYAGDWIDLADLHDVYFSRQEAEERLKELQEGGQ